MRKYSSGIILVAFFFIFLALASVPADAAGLLDSAWPKFHHDLNNSGLSPYSSDSTGVLNWSYTTGGIIYGSPAIDSSGNIYFGSDDGNFYALYPNSSLKWSYYLNDWIHSSPAIDSNGDIYFGSDNYNFYALYPNGSLKWSYAVEGVDSVRSSPTIDSDGIIYFGSDDTNLYALYPNGTKKWSYPTGSSIRSSPAIDSSGNIYFGSADHVLYAIYPNGSLKWSYTAGGPIESSSTIDSNGNIYFGTYGAGDHKLYALYPNGSLKWNYTPGNSVISTPAIDSNGNIYFGSGDYKLYALYPNGTQKWNYTTGDWIPSSPAIDSDGNIYVGSEDFNLYAIYPNGTKKWSYATGSYINRASPVIDSAGNIYVGSDDGKLYSFKGEPPTYIPPSPINLAVTQGNFYVNYTWSPGSGNVTDSYNISFNSTWTNGSANNWLNVSVGPHGWGNISVYAFNSSGGGTLNLTPVSANTQVSNNIISISGIQDSYTLTEGQSLYIDANYTDVDSDTGTFNRNFTQGTFNTGTGILTWSTADGDQGTYYWEMNVSDGYGSMSTQAFMVTVYDSTPGTPTSLVSSTSNFYVNYSWDKDVNTDSFNISYNGTWTNGSSATSIQRQVGAHGWGNISVYAYNSSGVGILNTTAASQNTQIPNNPISISGVQGSYSLNEGDTLNIDADYSDADSDPGTFARNFSQGSLNTGTGVLTWMPAVGDRGTYHWQVNVSDGYGSVSSADFTVTVNTNLGGGGGTGGGSAWVPVSVTPAEPNPEIKSYTTRVRVDGDNVSIVLSQSDKVGRQPVDSLNLFLQQAYNGEYSITVTTYSSFSPSLPNTYQYFKIDTDLLTKPGSSMIIKVPKSFTDKYASIEVYTANSPWASIGEPKLLSESITDKTYRVSITKLGTFAIAGRTRSIIDGNLIQPTFSGALNIRRLLIFGIMMLIVAIVGAALKGGKPPKKRYRVCQS